MLRNFLQDVYSHVAMRCTSFRSFSGLCRVAMGFITMIPGARALECDIGSIGDIIASKRSRFSPGMIESMIMIKINKSLKIEDSTKNH